MTKPSTDLDQGSAQGEEPPANQEQPGPSIGERETYDMFSSQSVTTAQRRPNWHKNGKQDFSKLAKGLGSHGTG